MGKRKPGVAIMVVMEDGPVQCLVPIPRADLSSGAECFTVHYATWRSATYRLAWVDQNRVHHYRWDNPLEETNGNED